MLSLANLAHRSVTLVAVSLSVAWVPQAVAAPIGAHSAVAAVAAVAAVVSTGDGDGGYH